MIDVLGWLVGEIGPVSGAVTGLGAIVGGPLALWHRARPRCRLEPAGQGRDWQRFFQSGDVWRLRLRVVQSGPEVLRPVVRVDRVELLDYDGKVIAVRRNISIDLQPLRDKGSREEMLPIPCEVRGAVNAGSVHRVRIKGRLLARARLGWRSESGFSFAMASNGPYSGDMIEADW